MKQIPLAIGFDAAASFATFHAGANALALEQLQALAAPRRDGVAAPLYLWGPRIAYNPFPNANFHLLFCDECGVPAAAAIIDSLPADAHGHLVAEVKDAAAIPPMPFRDGIQIDWVFSGEVEPGESKLLLSAVQQVPVPQDALVYAWGGGEMKSMRQIGRHLRKSWGLKTASISATVSGRP